MRMSTAPLCIHIRSLRVTLRPQHRRDTGKHLVHVPELRIAQGTVTALLGPSGAGKSTLLRAINRLNDCWPALRTEGQVSLRLEGQTWPVYAETEPQTRMSCYPLDRLRRKVGMVFQHPQLLPLSIARNVTLPLTEGAGLSKSEAQARMQTVLRQVGLWGEVAHRLQAEAACLSGGQMQRLCLARTLALEPEILLLDEPTASLDARAAGQVEQVIQDLAGRLTILLVTHSQAQADRLACRQVRMADGEVRP